LQQVIDETAKAGKFESISSRIDCTAANANKLGNVDHEEEGTENLTN